MAMIPHKGHSDYLVRRIEAYVAGLEHAKVILQGDGEGAIRTVVNAVAKSLGPDRAQARLPPRYSHQSHGAIEGVNAFLAGQIRTWMGDIRQRFDPKNESIPPLDVNHILFPWLCLYVAWSMARFHVRHGLTAYRVVKDKDYLSQVAPFGEIVLVKFPNLSERGKARPRWAKGAWVGRLEIDNAHAVLTEGGAISVRTIRRLPEESRRDLAILNAVHGLPWSPKEGVRKPVKEHNYELSMPVALALPTGAADADEQADSESTGSEPEGSFDYSPSPGGAGEAAPGSEPGGLATPVNIPGQEDMAVDEGGAVDPALLTPKRSLQASPPDSPYRGGGNSSHLAALPQVPAMPSGLGGPGGVPRNDPPPPGARVLPGSPSRAELGDGKCQRMSLVKNTELWTAIQNWATSTGEDQLRLCSVMEMMDYSVGNDEWLAARREEIDKFEVRTAFKPRIRRDLPHGTKLFNHKWVDEKQKGVVKSRCTCADLKAKYSPEENAELDTHVPTPLPESRILLEQKALLEQWPTLTADIVQAFLIGLDPGDAAGQPVHMRSPKEWNFLAWLARRTKAVQAEYSHYRTTDDVVWEVTGDLCGRRTAGAVYRHELEEILMTKVRGAGFHFRRGEKDPTTYRCEKTQMIVLRHIDDFRSTGPPQTLINLFGKELPKYVGLKLGQLEYPGTVVEVLGRRKYRTEDMIATVPDPKHRENIIRLMGTQGAKPIGTPSRPRDNVLELQVALPADRAHTFREATGNAIH